MNWQPMETAPKDGTAFLVVEFDSVDFDKPNPHSFQYVARWSEAENDWEVRWEDKPVPYYWMPLPDPPFSE